MLGIDCMFSIKFPWWFLWLFFFCSTCIVGLGYVGRRGGLLGRGGELRLGVNIAKCRNATTKVFRDSIILKSPTFDEFSLELLLFILVHRLQMTCHNRSLMGTPFFIGQLMTR